MLINSYSLEFCYKKIEFHWRRPQIEPYIIHVSKKIQHSLYSARRLHISKSKLNHSFVCYVGVNVNVNES